MSKPFRLSVTKVRALGSGYDEFSNDEMSIFGFAVSGFGKRFHIKPVNLGSYSEGETRSLLATPIELLNEQVNDTDNICALCLFLIERDNGDVISFANNAPDKFDIYWDNALQQTSEGMSATEKNLYAFAQSMIPLAYALAKVNSFGDSDETYPPRFHTIPARPGPGFPGEEGRNLVTQFDGNGFYEITLNYDFEKELVTG